jgi:hypothetical protein
MTKRGSDALLSLVANGYDNVDDDTTNKRKLLASSSSSSSRRKALLSSIASDGSGSTSGSISGNGVYSSTNSILQRQQRQRQNQNTIKMATSQEECDAEWKLIREAMNIIQQNSPEYLKSTKSKARSKSKKTLPPLPPIYPADSTTTLWDGNSGNIDSDDDEWLLSVLSSNDTLLLSVLELENILQADQIVKRIVNTFEWGTHCHRRRHRRQYLLFVK